MAIYEITTEHFRRIDETTFGAAGLKERGDLQRLLRGQIEIVSPDTLIISEEFGEWEDSRRRIDLLGIDKDANLVVIELKRTEDGGHMELQSLRYAAMVSAMTFERAVEVYDEFLSRADDDRNARTALLEFLEWDEPDEEQFAQDVRIVLVSAEFSKELTTTVIWLTDRGLDIRCIRIKPYSDNGRILADVQSIIPLPEAEDYRVRIKEKQQQERAARKVAYDWTKYDVTTNGTRHERLPKRGAIFAMIRHLCSRKYIPEQIAATVSWRKSDMFRSADGELNTADFVAEQKAKERAGGRKFAEKRFYCKEGELIHAGGKTYAFTNQWGQRCLEAMDCLVKAFPQENMTYEASSSECDLT